ncbi:Transposase DDE domain protein [Maioricimonas rarisocia]|uniref:Transposase DDE domain protein n=1 Tax=Maioricimonas rarisocia TaxID=2528026 RepID=A0A517ZG62_9PLAN|nr:IS4 family transposase [Maioricimonas rarisocia]QDU41476.1 Transposase DDE domain protein [Maioricimonas rarisocia]
MARKQGRNLAREQLKAEFEKWLPPHLFRGIKQHGNSRWKPRLLVIVDVIMFWVSGDTLDERFRSARHLVRFLWPKENIPGSYSGFVNASIRLWPELRDRLVERLRACEGDDAAVWRVKGWLVLAVDGSRFECPRSDRNEQGLGCAGREKTTPQLFHTLLQHVGTGLPWDFRVGPGTDSERHHLQEMLEELPVRTMLTADAGFISYDLCHTLMDSGHTFVLRVGGNKTFLTGLEADAPQDDRIVYFWPQAKRSRPPLKLRQIRFPSTGGLPVVLVTNVLDDAILSDETAKQLYESRWGIEVFFRHLKQTFDFGRMLSRTPETAMNEHCWKLISFWFLQRMAVAHQLTERMNPRRFSAATARREIRELLQLMQQNRRGPSVKRRFIRMKGDDYERSGPKTTGKYPRKKTERPPSPPTIQPAKPCQIRRARSLGIKTHLIS